MPRWRRTPWGSTCSKHSRWQSVCGLKPTRLQGGGYLSSDLPKTITVLCPFTDLYLSCGCLAYIFPHLEHRRLWTGFLLQITCWSLSLFGGEGFFVTFLQVWSNAMEVSNVQNASVEFIESSNAKKRKSRQPAQSGGHELQASEAAFSSPASFPHSANSSLNPPASLPTVVDVSQQKDLFDKDTTPTNYFSRSAEGGILSMRGLYILGALYTSPYPWTD